jgi:hypothetical protein
MQSLIINQEDGRDTWREQAGYRIMFEGADAFGNVGVATPPVVVPVQPDNIESETPNGLPPLLGAGLWG